MIMLAGVPVSVAMPPHLPAYVMLSVSALATLAKYAMRTRSRRDVMVSASSACGIISISVLSVAAGTRGADALTSPFDIDWVSSCVDVSSSASSDSTFFRGFSSSGRASVSTRSVVSTFVSICTKIASTIGSMSVIEATLLIHIDRNHDVTAKPTIRLKTET